MAVVGGIVGDSHIIKLTDIYPLVICDLQSLTLTIVIPYLIPNAIVFGPTTSLERPSEIAATVKEYVLPVVRLEIVSFALVSLTFLDCSLP